MIDFLNLGSDEKSTLAGSEFQTLTIRSVKKLRRFRFRQFFQLPSYELPPRQIFHAFLPIIPQLPLRIAFLCP